MHFISLVIKYARHCAQEHVGQYSFNIDLIRHVELVEPPTDKHMDEGYLMYCLAAT